MTTDGHDSACTYRKCAHPEAGTACPFVMSQAAKAAVLPIPELSEPQCKHEWRQFWTKRKSANITFKDMVTGGFYCIFCLELHE